MSGTRRSMGLVDYRVQGALILRVLMHWSLFAVVMFVVLFCWQFITSDPSHDLQSNLERMWHRYGPAFMVLLTLLPVVVYDTVKLSNRLAGPLYRLRRATKSVIDGQGVKPIRFRKGDFCQDLADNFNVLIDRLQSNPAKAQEPTANPESQHS